MWDARTGIPQLELKGHAGYVRSVAFSPDGSVRIITASADTTAKVWDARTGTTTLDLKGHTGVVSSVAFNLDGTRIVTGSADRTENVWDARTGQELKGETVRKTPRTGPISPDGRLIARGRQPR